MSYPSKQRWLGRIALGLALTSVMFVGRASGSQARIDPGSGCSSYVKAGGWSGMVDRESGIPCSAGIPSGNEQAVEVIPYLSHGILTQEEADAAAVKAIHDPFLNDINVRPGESLGGPDGGPKVTHPQAARGARTQPEIVYTDRMWTDRD
jgi:hypothetical protein